MTGPWLSAGSVADAGAYLSRLVRLDRSALVRLRPLGEGAVALWARLPFDVLVTRAVAGPLDVDATVRAADLLARLADPAGRPEGLPTRRDAEWRWPLPAGSGEVVEHLPAAEIRRIGAAAEVTVREAVSAGVRGRAVGERMVRDALLDHVPVVVTTAAGDRVEVSQRLVQGVVRMGFLGPPDAAGPPVGVRVAGEWVGLAGAYGCTWYRRSISLHVLRRP